MSDQPGRVWSRHDRWCAPWRAGGRAPFECDCDIRADGVMRDDEAVQALAEQLTAPARGAS